MKTSIPALLASTALAWAPALARPNDDTVATQPQPPESAGPELAQAPPSPAPEETPPPPPAKPPAPPKESVAPPGAQGRAQAPSGSAAQVPPGQWVYTREYGWVWMPQGDAYRYDGTGGSYAYVYYPAVGWTWLGAPWGGGWWGWWGPWWGWGWGPWWWHRPFFHGHFRHFPGFRPFPGHFRHFPGHFRPFPGHFRGIPRATPAPARQFSAPRGRR